MSQIELLVTIPGIERLVAWQLIAELGTDLTVFPDADHCASWAGLVPGENEAGEGQEHTLPEGQQELATGAYTGSLGGVALQDGLPARVFARQGPARLG